MLIVINTAVIAVITPAAKAHAQPGGSKEQYNYQYGGYLTENGQRSSLRKITENSADDKYHTGYKKHSQYNE
jgi:hypothetical protein